MDHFSITDVEERAKQAQACYGDKIIPRINVFYNHTELSLLPYDGVNNYFNKLQIGFIGISHN